MKRELTDRERMLIFGVGGVVVVAAIIYLMSKNKNRPNIKCTHRIKLTNPINPKTMKIIKFFVPIIWTLLALYLISCLFDIMNIANTMASFIGLLSTILIVYLSYRYRLGLTLITKKNKTT